MGTIDNEDFLIFMAEDDTDDQQIFTETIAEVDQNINIQLFDNGETVLHEMDTTSTLPNIIFLDLLMPKKNGEECLKELRANSSFDNIPIVVYSNLYDIERISNLFELGANRYLHKPASFKILTTALSRTIHSIKNNSLGGTAIIHYAD
ncbi:response regulator [Maribacter sp. MAR_2009_72]|uniref:response regulator n=1 Tax=Maribacter sp. MAR_2009_72 TaxID=1250050 RepID=UPI001199F6D0|nr:response regulator [Maribacter sp. MAR_2009_72]TVZ15459.1 response regulator receiver domain-containing protein [Maribacter sp. MAR_2009_72]